MARRPWARRKVLENGEEETRSGSSLKRRRIRGIERPYVPLLKGAPLPFVLVILLGDRHSVPGGLVNVIVCLYPHLVRYSAEALEAPARRTREVNRKKNKELVKKTKKKVTRIRS